MKKTNTITKTIFTSAPKVSAKGFNFSFNFSKWKEKMEKEKELGGNFRQKAERAGVPPEKVKDFKYWLRANPEPNRRKED